MVQEKRIKPFLATYYNPHSFVSLKKLVCPPYDVISKDEKKKFLKSSSYNFCHVLLKKNTKSYEELGKTFRKWLKEGILVEDNNPAFYLTLQNYCYNKLPIQAFWININIFDLLSRI